MSNPFIHIYLFFRKYRVAFFLFCLLTFAFILFFAARIRMEEDITGMTGMQEGGDKFGYVTTHFTFADKLVIHLFHSDPASPAAGEDLTTPAKEFCDSLRGKFDSTYVKAVAGNISDSGIISFLRLISDNLPLFLNESDYDNIRKMLDPASIDSSLEKNYKTLLSPAGFIVKDRIRTDPLGLTYIVFNKLRNLQVSERFIISNGFIMTRDKRDLLILVTPANPVNETSKNAKLVKGIGQMLAQLSSKYNGKIRGEYFGAVAMACSNASQLKKDCILTISIALILIILLIAWYFRSIKIPFLGFLPAIYGGGLALAVLFIVKGTVSAIALGIGSVILGLIVDYALYLINHYYKYGDMEKALKEMSLTIMLCAITSAGAFLCLIFLRSSVLHDLGWFAAISVLGAAFFALLILPHLLSKNDTIRNKAPRNNFIDRIAAFPFEKKHGIAGILVLAAVAAAFFVGKAGFEKDMRAMNFATPRLSQAEKNLDRISGISLKNVYAVSTGKNLEEALRGYERKAENIELLKQSGLVSQVSGPGAILVSDSLQQERIRKWEDFWTRERVSSLKKTIIRSGARFRFTETAFGPFFDLLEKRYSPVGADSLLKAGAPFISDWVKPGGKIAMVSSVLKVKEENRPEVYQALSKYRGLVTFDRQLLAEKFIENVHHDFSLLVRLSMLFVTVLLFISFGRIELAILTAIPMYLSWLLTLGFMGVTGIRFNIINIILSSFIFGLGVDYSILMMRGLLHDYKYGTSGISSYKSSIFISSVTTLFGVCALFFAKHPALNSIALISLFGIGSVVISAYTLQPLIAGWFLTDRLRKRTYPVTARIMVKSFITWGNIVLVAVIQVIWSLLLRVLFFIPAKKKEYLFHKLFQLTTQAYIWITFTFDRKFLNPHGEDFHKPAIIISNHQSLIETPAFLRLHPKILILTRDWVWNSPLFGPVARVASFFNVDEGLDNIMDRLREKVAEGYSILIFPEAHRSTNQKINRFHKGAFYLAEKLNIDLLPVMIFGTGDFLGKHEFWGRPGSIRMKVMDRIRRDDMRYGADYPERTKKIRKLYIDVYRQFTEEEGTGNYYRRKLMLNFVFKGPVLEWYARIKLKIEHNYEMYNRLLPKQGMITDLGCGYGFITYMLMLTSQDRLLTGIDYDEEKINVADNGYLHNDRIRFIHADVSNYMPEMSEGFLLSDVLHYLTEEQQKNVLKRCMENLNAGGVILIREANAELERRHRQTRFTEYLSTRTGFNRTAGKEKRLWFTGAGFIRNIAEENGCSFEIIDLKKITSNNFFLIKKIKMYHSSPG